MDKLLIADDSLYMRTFLKDMIKDRFEEIIEAPNGKVAVKKCFNENPDIITLDITMPVMDGIDALRLIKELDKDVYIIMVSAIVGQQAFMVDILEGRADDFLVKPFSKEKVIKKFKKAELV